jgi:hypothetical protein
MPTKYCPLLLKISKWFKLILSYIFSVGKASAPAHAPYLHPCRHSPPYGESNIHVRINILKNGKKIYSGIKTKPANGGKVNSIE